MRWYKESAKLIAGKDVSTLPREGTYDDSMSRYQGKSQQTALHKEMWNSFDNHLDITTYCKSHDVYLPSQCKGKGPAIIVGSGPSLDDIAPRLKDWKGAIFTSTTQASTLVYHGRAPEYVVCFDTYTKPDELKAVPDWSKYNTTLICHPGLSHDLLEYWTNPKLFYRNMDPSNTWFTEVLPAAYPALSDHVITFAHTVATQVAVANLMGYSPLILCGVDLGYPDGDVRFTRYRFGEGDDAEAEQFFDESISVVAENGVVTDRVMLLYKRALYCVWRLDRTQILSASRGVCHELPRLTVDEVFAGDYEKHYLHEWEIMERAERYLAKYNTYAVPMGGGLRFIESSNWKVDIPQMLSRLISIGVRGVNVDEYMDRVARLKGEDAEGYVREEKLG